MKLLKNQSFSTAEAIESIRINPSNFLKLSSDMKQDPKTVLEIVTSNPMVAPFVCAYFMKRSSSDTSLNIDDISRVVEKAVEINPSVFPLIEPGFISQMAANIMMEKMKSEKKYYASWVFHIPRRMMDLKFMDEAVKAKPDLMSVKHPFWKTPDGERLRSGNGFKKRSSSIRRIMSFGNLASKTGE